MFGSDNCLTSEMCHTEINGDFKGGSENSTSKQ